jgi:hypothetical protein
MPDPATVVGLSALGGIIAKDTISRLLGPTADFLGEEMKEFAKRRKETIGKSFCNGAEKANLDEYGAVPPRVVRDIVNQGSFQDDDLAVEYFGGVLASSRTPCKRDDRSATFTGLVSRLSTYQIRSHFIFYSVLRSLHLNDKHAGLASSAGRQRLKTYIPFGPYADAMAFIDGERTQFGSIIEHIMWGLRNEGLVDNFSYGNALAGYSDLSHGIVFEPTVLGAELFLRAHGKQSPQASEIFRPDLKITVKCQIPLPLGARSATTS